MIDELLDVLPGLRLAEAGTSDQVTVSPGESRSATVTVQAADGLPRLRVEVDLAAAVGYWRPGRGSQALAPDWTPPTVTSLVRDAPVGVLHDAAGLAIFGWAGSESVAEISIRAGVSEERKTFVVEVQPLRPLSEPMVIMVDAAGDDLAATTARLARWMTDQVSGEALPVPAVARRPVYSTWYTFTQDVTADVVLSEGLLAADLGCGSVFVDDGWQRLAHGRGYQGCGDWVPDQDKFPDLTATVARLQDAGLEVALWIAPLLLGEQSDAYATIGRFAPVRQDGGLRCHVLDPRHREVRDHLAATCLRLVTDYGVRLLKIDFLDQAMVYRDEQTGGDLDDVGVAMASLLAALRQRLDEHGHREVALEFRQPYVSPPIARYGQILRAGDCPADSLANRTRTVDARLLAVGQVVHADPLMWGATGGAEAVAQQLYAGWFAVPQISMRLADLDREQTEAVRGLLTLWQSQREVVLDGRLHVTGAELGYPLVTAEQADLRRSVTVRSAPLLVEAAADVDEITVINACWSRSVLVRVGAVISSGVLRSAAGAEVGTVAEHPAGLVELDVPAFGSVTLVLVG